MSHSNQRDQTGRSTPWKTSVAVGALCCLCLSAAAQNVNPRVLPPGANAFGRTYSEWAASWWQWAFSIPADISPLNDTTGAYGAQGQSGHVWFLAGLTGTPGGPVTRTLAVPVGKALFFPVVNEMWVNMPELGDNPWSPGQEVFARTFIANVMDTAADLTCQIDGAPLINLAGYRMQTAAGQAFMVNVPVGDVWGLVSAGATPGLHGPCVDDGIYLLVAPLSAGAHTIHFTASLAGGFHLDVTYNLTVGLPSLGLARNVAD
ncbi:MAG TPA: hypothetical protein VJA21_14250 [Verrucomicrobiae bacterium]